MKKEKRSFFERITGRISSSSGDQARDRGPKKEVDGENWSAEEQSEAELAIDVYQTPSEIVLVSMIAGVKPEDLDISITREMVVIKAKREEPEAPEKEKYLYKELYWGSFGRTIVLPDEVDADNSEAIERHGLLVIKLPKINKNHSRSLKVKSL